MNLAESFTASAQKHSDKTALFCGDAEFSYAQFLAQACWLAVHFQQEFGVQPGDRVALWLKNCPEFIPSLYGVLMAGGIVVPINNFLKPDEVKHILEDAGVKVMITQSAFAEALPILRANRPGLRFFQME